MAQSIADIPKAPVAGSNITAQSITATVASTAAQAINDTSTGGCQFEFVSTGLAHVRFGVASVGAADTTDWLVTQTPRRIWIDPGQVTHLRAIRNGAADVIVSFSRVR